MKTLIQALLAISLLGCTAQTPEAAAPSADVSVEAQNTQSENNLVAVTGVEVSGASGAYNFAVTIQSPDTGCDQYANWWEVVGPDGQLLYRRILAHSHVEEQPFTRSGSPIPADADQPVIVRVHMNTTGYSPQVFKGLPGKVLVPVTLPDDFAPELSDAEPQPGSCTF